MPGVFLEVPKVSKVCAYGRGSQGGRAGKALSGSSQTAELQLLQKPEVTLSRFGFARIASELAQLSWIRIAMQSPLGKIPLVADSRTQALASDEAPPPLVLRQCS